MLVAKDCLNLKLVKTAHAADDFIWVSGADAVKLNSIGVGNYINLTISDNRACETVRYDHVADWPATSAPKQLPVIRDVGATGRKNFGVNSCAVADWSVTQITEYIEQVAGGTASIASLSTSTSTGLSAVNSSVASLSTSTSTALSAITSTTTLLTVTAPTTPPAPGGATTSTNANGEVFKYVEGTGWVLFAKGMRAAYTNAAMEPSEEYAAVFTMPRDGLVSVSASFLSENTTEPVVYVYADMGVFTGNTLTTVLAGDTRQYEADVQYTGVSLANTGAAVSAGDTIRLRVASADTSATFRVSASYLYIE